MKLFLRQRKQTASSFQLRQKYYFQITRNQLNLVVGNKQENRPHFEVLVSYEYSHA